MHRIIIPQQEKQQQKMLRKEENLLPWFVLAGCSASGRWGSALGDPFTNSHCDSSVRSGSQPQKPDSKSHLRWLAIKDRKENKWGEQRGSKQGNMDSGVANQPGWSEPSLCFVQNVFWSSESFGFFQPHKVLHVLREAAPLYTLLSTPGTFLPGWPSLLHLMTQGKPLQLFRVTNSTAKMKKIHPLRWLKGWNLN